MRVDTSVEQQIERLARIGVLDRAHGDAHVVRDTARSLTASSGSVEGALVGLHPRWFRPSELAPLMVRDGKPGFVVEDMVDVDEFGPVGMVLPDAPLYLVRDVQRGDRYQNESPAEVLPALTARHRRPLTLQEGLSWALTQPGIIEANNCFMTIGSRRVKGRNRAGEPVHDARTPAIWNASGTGRDGRERRNAPKLGWCWWGNRHTWLGIASAAE